MPKAQPYSGEIDEKVALQLLNSGGVRVGDALLGDALVEAARKLAEVVGVAQGFLENNDMVSALAEHLAAKLGRRGVATISVDPSGVLKLDIAYREAAEPTVPTRRRSTLPRLRVLEAEAKKLGVDISQFGIKRREIYNYLQGIKRRGKAEPKVVRIAEEPVVEQISVRPDETKLSEALAMEEIQIPKRRGFVKTGDAVSVPVVLDAPPRPEEPPKPPKPPERRLQRLVHEADSVNISELLMSEPPEQ